MLQFDPRNREHSARLPVHTLFVPNQYNKYQEFGREEISYFSKFAHGAGHGADSLGVAEPLLRSDRWVFLTDRRSAPPRIMIVANRHVRSLTPPLPLRGTEVPEGEGDIVSLRDVHAKRQPLQTRFKQKPRDVGLLSFLRTLKSGRDPRPHFL